MIADHILIQSVSELTQSLKSTVESQYRFVHIHGEVSNLRIPYSGHIYFTLKDSGATLRAVLFKGQRCYLAQDIQEGQHIICHGRITIYEARGEYQIIIDTVDFKGTGNLQLQFEALKKKLHDEGLFHPERKKEIPPYPENIVVITSPTGAAIHDFLKISKKRQFWGKISIFPVSVQGSKAASEIASAIEAINKYIVADIIVLIRGGGSLEDLWSFNEEVVARSIFLSHIPVVTGIGHETDISIADLCSDAYTATPTAAAESIISDSVQTATKISYYRTEIVSFMDDCIGSLEKHVNQLTRIIGDLGLYLENYNLKLDFQISSLINSMLRRLSDSDAEIRRFSNRLQNQATDIKITMLQQKIVYTKDTICQKIIRILEKKTDILGKHAALLDAASPLAILSRGYSIVYRGKMNGSEKEIVRSSVQIEIDEIVDIKLHQGELRCQIKKKKL